MGPRAATPGRLAALACALFLGACASLGPAPQPEPPRPAWSIVVHGGAGVIERANLSPDLDAQYRAAMHRALQTGARVLDGGGSAVDAVEAVVREMEDDPLFNAGRGAVFSAEGRNELDAAVMDGRTRAAGAVAGVRTTRNPISLARRVMEFSPHVMMVGEGADAFGRSQGLDQAQPAYFFTERRWRQLEQWLLRNNLPLLPRPPGAPPPEQTGALGADDRLFGTVGVVAMDRRGDIAAGTSTGGTTGKRWGRVGDTPVIGAGTYAQNGVCGVSATGTGEFFIRVAAARTICARMELQGMSAEQAADATMAEIGALRGDGGVIVMDGRGRIAWSFNTPGMYRARLEAGGRPLVAIFADEE